MGTAKSFQLNVNPPVLMKWAPSAGTSVSSAPPPPPPLVWLICLCYIKLAKSSFTVIVIKQLNADVSQGV